MREIDVSAGLYPQNHEKKVVFLFDEIQIVKNWPLFVNRLQTTENCQVYITGSSARLLSKELATELGGRTFTWELFPFSFAEFLVSKGISCRLEYLEKKDTAAAAFKQYPGQGGFPELFSMPDSEMQTAYLQNLVMEVTSRDIALRYKIQNLELVKTLAQLLLQNMGCLITVNKLRQRLTGMQFSVSAAWIARYMTYFEDAFLIFSVPLFTASRTVQAVNPRKVYCIDHALSAAVSVSPFLNSGAALENMVFMHLRRKGKTPYYYRTKNGYKIDFVTGKEGSLMLYQVCADVSDEDTRRRELRALVQASEELQVSRPLLITFEQEEQVQQHDCIIQIIRARDFLSGYSSFDGE